MDPKRLLIFRAVARAGSISGAARDARLDPARGEPAPARARAVGRLCPAAARRRRRRAHRAGTRAARPRGRTGGPAAHGRGGAGRAHGAAARAGPARGVPVRGGDLVPARHRRPAGPAPRDGRRAHRGRAAGGARPARRPATSTSALVFGYGDDPVDTRGLRWTPLADEPVALVRRRGPSRRTPQAADAARPGRRAVDRRLRAVPGAHVACCAPRPASSRGCATSATTTSWCRTSSPSVSASPCCRARRSRPTGTPT